jgi:hypothetical protein
MSRVKIIPHPEKKEEKHEYAVFMIIVEIPHQKGFSFGKSKSKNYPLLYNSKKQICLKDANCYEHLPEIMESMSSSIPKDAVIWVPIDIAREDFVKVANTFIVNGFAHPYINTVSPHSANIPPSVCLSKKNGEENMGVSPDMTLNKVYDVLNQYKNNKGVCFINIQLTDHAVEFLKSTCFSGFTKNKNGKKSQKELTGELYVKNVVPKAGKFVYIIDINKSSVKAGQNESVDVEPHRYNFHSHPEQAYVRHSVDKAWPSVVDYLGYLQLGKNTIFHCVASIEGMYVLSFTPYWSQRLDMVDKKVRKFVDKNFEIDHKEDYTPEEYTEVINNIKYRPRKTKNGHRPDIEPNAIFKVEFFPWEKAGDMFSVFFPQIGSSCLVSQKIVNNYKRIHH